MAAASSKETRKTPLRPYRFHCRFYTEPEGCSVVGIGDSLAALAAISFSFRLTAFSGLLKS